MRLHGLGDALSTIADTIQQVEGYYPGSLAYRNNNPGNIIYTSYYASNFGATPGAGGFAAFPDYSTGYAALQNQIQLDAARGWSIYDMMYSWLGSGTGGNTAAYASTIANALGVSTDARVSDVLAGSVDPSLPIVADDSTPPPPDYTPWMIGAGLALAAYLVVN